MLEVVGCAGSAGGLSCEGDIGWIAAEAGNVALDPEEGGALVAEAVVGLVAGGFQFFGIEEAGVLEAVVQGDGDAWFLQRAAQLDEFCHVVLWPCCAADQEGTAMDKDEHGKVAIEIEAPVLNHSVIHLVPPS